jgi:ubiquitin-conjugating enzyme E2 J1
MKKSSASSGSSSSGSKSPSLRRIQADIRELALSPSDRYHAAPLESDMFEWHFTIRGSDGTDFEHGIYHGRILLPPEYPFKPPHIIFLTKSGRFEINTKICLSFSAFHPELWQPAWGIRLILEALIAFLPTPADGALGSLDWTSAERKALAKESQRFFCPTCNCHVRDLLPKMKSATPQKDNSNNNNNDEKVPEKKSVFHKEIEQLQMWQALEHPKEEEPTTTNQTTPAVAVVQEEEAAAAAAAANTPPPATSATKPMEPESKDSSDVTTPKVHSSPLTNTSGNKIHDDDNNGAPSSHPHENTTTTTTTSSSSSPSNSEKDSIAFLGDIMTPRSTGITTTTKKKITSMPNSLIKDPRLEEKEAPSDPTNTTHDSDHSGKVFLNASSSPASSRRLLEKKLPALSPTMEAAPPVSSSSSQSEPILTTTTPSKEGTTTTTTRDTRTVAAAAAALPEQEPLLAPSGLNQEVVTSNNNEEDNDHENKPPTTTTPHHHDHHANSIPTWLDPMLQMIILILSVSAFCLLRRIQTLLSELRSLEE